MTGKHDLIRTCFVCGVRLPGNLSIAAMRDLHMVYHCNDGTGRIKFKCPSHSADEIETALILKPVFVNGRRSGAETIQ